VLVRDLMTPTPITVAPTVDLPEAMQLMKKHRIRRLPVVDNGRLVGIVTDRDLREASPSSATSLSMWELTYLLSRTTVKDFMKHDIITIAPDAPIEQAALILNHEKIGGLPVVEDQNLVGIVTESDVFRCFTTLLGAERGFLQITIVDSEESRAKVALLLRLPALRTVSFHPSRPETLLVFATPRGLSDARQILEEVRSYSNVAILSWHLSEPEIPPPPQTGNGRAHPSTTPS
jgi:acetoin utilization protein AcuB